MQVGALAWQMAIDGRAILPALLEMVRANVVQ